MCGIFGKVNVDGGCPVTEHEILEGVQSLDHRGPDGKGVWVKGPVGLGHSRLAIIDLRVEANQPMANEDGTVWVTFNGEIYNFHELRNELETRGHAFRTSSDTEVLVHGYEEYGHAVVEHLRGMFAFAIWDGRMGRLFAARDRLGKKPFYYFLNQGKFVFGSEIKALLTDPAVCPDLDPVALDHFLALQYVPAPLSALRNIRKLPAAHWLELRDGHLEVGRYWKLHYVPKIKISLAEAIDEVRWRFAEAVRLRMESDVPLGAFLSGGIDSSAVVAHMAMQSAHPVRTFSIGFKDAKFDERPFARMVAERFGTRHTELVVEEQVTDILSQLAWHYDEPFGDASAVPSYAIAKLTRQDVTVVLNGDGGDENFAGYDWYVTDRLIRFGDYLPMGIRKTLAAWLHHIPPKWRRAGLLRKMAKISKVLAQTPERRYAQWLGHMNLDERHQLYTPDFLDGVEGNDPEGNFVRVFQESDAENCTDAVLDVDVNLFLVDDLLVKVDRATMAHSLEARSPFLDHVFMEFVACLPTDFKLRGKDKKHLLKASLRGMIPDEVMDRPKMGFCVPLARWFREDLRELAHDLLLSPTALQRGYFQQHTIERWLKEHDSGQEDRAVFLWDLLMLELWHRTFLDQTSAIRQQSLQLEKIFSC